MCFRALVAPKGGVRFLMFGFCLRLIRRLELEDSRLKEGRSKDNTITKLYKA